MRRWPSCLACLGVSAVAVTTVGTGQALAFAAPVLVPPSVVTSTTGLLSGAVAEATGSAATITSAGGVSVAAGAAAGGAAIAAAAVLGVATVGFSIGWAIGSHFVPDDPDPDVAGQEPGPSSVPGAWSSLTEDWTAEGSCINSAGYGLAGQPARICIAASPLAGATAGRIGVQIFGGYISPLVFIHSPDAGVGVVGLGSSGDLTNQSCDFPAISGCGVQGADFAPGSHMGYMRPTLRNGTTIGVFTPAGSPSPPPEPHPLRRLLGVSECTPTAGGAAQLVNLASADYRTTDSPLPNLPVPDCPQGSTRTRWKVTAVPVTPGAGTPQVLVDVRYPSPSDAPTYADCLGTHSCVLDYAPPTTAGDPEACMWGTHVMPQSDCTTTGSVPAPVDPDSGEGNDDGCSFTVAKPWTWPLSALKCAFVPSPAAVTSFRGSVDGLGGKVPFGFVPAITGLGTAVADGADGPCWHGVHVAVLGYQQDALDLCPGGFLYEGLHPLRPFLGVAVWIALLIPAGLWLFRASVPVVGAGEGS